jgi:RNA polymerase sigma factor (sigma-70 family)
VQVAEPEHRSPADFELWARFHEAVGELDPEHREVVNLVFYQGQTQAEIATLLGLHERSVRRRWSDALLALRARVGADPGI